MCYGTSKYVQIGATTVYAMLLNIKKKIDRVLQISSKSVDICWFPLMLRTDKQSSKKTTIVGDRK